MNGGVKRGLVVTGIAMLGAALAAVLVRSRKTPSADLTSARQVLDELQPIDADGRYESRVGTTKIIIPASAWENARDAGLDMRETVERVQPNAWPLLNAVASDLGLSEIYLTSLYRATGTGPHTEGRSVDIGYVRRGSEPLVLLRNDTDPRSEPALAKALRLALKERGATQVLSPWWIYSKGTRDDPNTGAEGIDADHLSHLHVTLEAIA